MKKVLALVLAFALVFSTFGMAFADTTTTTPAAPELSADAKICADLGVLKGSTGTVDVAYTATAPTRLVAAIMALRLRGLEAEALAFTGTETFADAGTVNWAGGKAILAYLKAHPELGWAGNSGNFDPNSAVTAQQYYKVMLESLGYKQTTAEVTGDFKWEEVITFAATKGLTKVAAVTSFTINDVAVATVEALKVAVKGGTKTLGTTLVEGGVIDATKAATVGIYSAATTTAKLSSVKGIANDRIAVTFDADVDKTFAENVANYKVVVNGSTTALEVKAAVLEGTTVVNLTTAAQTGGAAYTLTVGDVSKNFAGLAKVTAAPEVDGNVTCIDTNTVEINFTKLMDKATAEDVVNYKLDNSATVKSAVLDSSRKTVNLTTEGVANNKVYKVTVSNVKSSDLVSIKTVTKTFAGITDIKAPSINKVTVVNNQRIKVYFTDTHGVDQATAQDLANWSISGDLKIQSATAVDEDEDDYGYYEMVELATDSMTSGQTYTLTINKMVDGSVSKNATTKTLTKDFKGIAIDKTAPVVSTMTVLGDSMVEVVFSETNRMDAATLADVANYTFDKDITVNSAEILNTAKVDLPVGRTVMLKTSALEKNKSYKLTVKNVADEFGNVMKDTTRTVVSQGEDLTPPYVVSTSWVSLTKVKLTFDSKLDLATATDIANYSVNKDLGAVIKAELNKTGATAYTVVTLTTPTQKVNTSYTVTVNNVKDRLGNALSGYKAYFVSSMDGTDTTRPEITSIDAVNKDEVRVTFDEAVKLNANTATITVDIAGVTLTQVGQPIDDETTLVFKRTGTAFANGTKYTVNSINYVSDKYNNYYKVDSASKPEFYGVTVTNDAPEVSTIEQVNEQEIKVLFSEPIKKTAATIVSTGIAQTFDIAVDADADNTTDAESTLTLTTQNGATIQFDKDYKFDFTARVTDYVDLAAADDTDTATVTANSTTFRTYINDEDDPVIDYVEAVNEKKVKVVYNEDLSSVGSYKITVGDTTTAAGGTLLATADPDNDNIVFVSCSSALSADTVYTLKPLSAAKDIAGNVAVVKDVELTFVGSSAKVQSYVKGVAYVDGTTIKITTSEAFGKTDTITITKDGGTKNLLSSTRSVLPEDVQDIAEDVTVANRTLHKTTHQFFAYEAFLEGVEYTVTITQVDAASGLLNDVTYTFEGQVASGGIDMTNIDTVGNMAGQITFSGWNATDYVVFVVYNGTSVRIDPISVTPGEEALNGTFTAYLGNADTGNADASTAADRLGIAAGETFTVEVYRTLASEPVTADGMTWLDGVYGSIRWADAADSGQDIVIDYAPLYSQEFVKK